MCGNFGLWPICLDLCKLLCQVIILGKLHFIWNHLPKNWCTHIQHLIFQIHGYGWMGSRSQCCPVGLLQHANSSWSDKCIFRRYVRKCCSTPATVSSVFSSCQFTGWLVWSKLWPWFSVFSNWLGLECFYMWVHNIIIYSDFLCQYIQWHPNFFSNLFFLCRSTFSGIADHHCKLRSFRHHTHQHLHGASERSAGICRVLFSPLGLSFDFSDLSYFIQL